MSELFAFEPLYGPSNGTTSAGNLNASVTVSASTTAASASLPGAQGGAAQRNIQIANQTTGWAYVNFGTANLTAATAAASYPVAPGAVVIVTVNQEVNTASVILSTGTGSVTFTRGVGL